MAGCRAGAFVEGKKRPNFPIEQVELCQAGVPKKNREFARFQMRNPHVVLAGQ